jgi:sulfatase maturation enzyme AslB (radical SAM superfamily)
LGGELTLKGLDLFQQVMEAVKKHAWPGMTIKSAFQTKGL